MKKQVTFYFSFTEIVEGTDEKQITQIAEEMAMKELGDNCFEYFDERTLEGVE